MIHSCLFGSQLCPEFSLFFRSSIYCVQSTILRLAKVLFKFAVFRPSGNTALCPGQFSFKLSSVHSLVSILNGKPSNISMENQIIGFSWFPCTSGGVPPGTHPYLVGYPLRLICTVSMTPQALSCCWTNTASKRPAALEAFGLMQRTYCVCVCPRVSINPSRALCNNNAECEGVFTTSSRVRVRCENALTSSVVDSELVDSPMCLKPEAPSTHGSEANWDVKIPLSQQNCPQCTQQAMYQATWVKMGPDFIFPCCRVAACCSQCG